MTSSSSTIAPAAKSTKRKIDDALHNLDDLLRSPDEVKLPVPKKARFPGSLYSTLAKYGIRSSKANSISTSKSNESNIIKKIAPNLSAILSRAATKRQKTTHAEELARASVTSTNTSSLQLGASEYRPSSIGSFLTRLSSFKLSTYANKPAVIDAVAASRAGWVNDGKDRLVCGICRSSWIVSPRDGMTRDAANALLEKQKTYLVQMHKDGCPWKSRQCDPSIYRILLKSPSVLAKEIKKHALELDDEKTLEGVEIRHPLTTSQVQGLMTSLASVRVLSPDASNPEDAEASNTHNTTSEPRPQPSLTAALTSLFGWALVPQNTLSSESQSIAPSPVMSTPGTPRKTNWNSSVSEAGTPVPPRRTPTPRVSSAVASRLQRLDNQKDHDSTLIHCSLCQRRVGLWAFKHSLIPVMSTTGSITTNESDPKSASRAAAAARRQSLMPKRQFDLLKEHRSYCPFIVRSTTVPSLPSVRTTPSPTQAPNSSTPELVRANSVSLFNFSFAPHNAPEYPAPSTTDGTPGDPSMVEGWRAVFTMVLRTGLSKRQRQRRLVNVGSTQVVPIRDPETETSGGEAGKSQSVNGMEIDGIQAMVADVKTRGNIVKMHTISTLHNNITLEPVERQLYTPSIPLTLTVEPSETDFPEIFDSQVYLNILNNPWAQKSVESTIHTHSSDFASEYSWSELSEDGCIRYNSHEAPSQFLLDESPVLSQKETGRRKESLSWDPSAMLATLSTASEGHEIDCPCVDCYLWRAYTSEGTVFKNCECLGCRS